MEQFPYSNSSRRKGTLPQDSTYHLSATVLIKTTLLFLHLNTTGEVPNAMSPSLFQQRHHVTGGIELDKPRGLRMNTSI